MAAISILAPVNQGFADKVHHVKKAVKSKEPPRDYYAHVSTEEKADIAYIVRTLANTSLIKILNHKSSLESAGQRVEHLHPLRFLQVIFTDEELKACMLNLQGKSWVWSDFLEGITSSLTKEAAADNLKQEHIKDFAKRVNIDVKLINPPLKKRDWEKFVDILIENVPREGNPDRYDM
jgi:glycyl-tRNA synthetase beta subunit